MKTKASKMRGEDPPVPEAPASPSLCGLLDAFRRLDQRLEQAIAAAEQTFGALGSDPYRGLYITKDEVRQLLKREPGSLAWLDESASDQAPETAGSEENGRLRWLSRVFNLSPFDTDAVVIALAPEVDLRYERLYAYLQDDVTRRRPSVDLVLNLLCSSSDEKIQARALFAPTAPLIRNGLIHLVQDPHHVHPPLLAHYVKLDEQIASFLLGQRSLDARLLPFCRLTRPAISFDKVSLSEESKLALRKLASQGRKNQRPLRLYFRGVSASEKESAAGALAARLRMQFLRADLNQIFVQSGEFRMLLETAIRDAWLLDAVVYFEGVDTLRDEHPVLYEQLVDATATHRGVTVFAGVKSGQPFPARLNEVIEIDFPMGDFRQRASSWTREIAKHNLPLEERDIDELASRFRLRTDQIASAVAGARSQSVWRAAATKNGSGRNPENVTTLSDLCAAARAQCGQTLATLAKKIEPLYTWDDIVLPHDALNQLREICQRVTHHHRVFEDWGFDHKLSLGKGVNALFSGPSGTGKTMAAEIVANELELDLYKIDLSSVVSKWIGETEKNLDRIFTAAEKSNAILFFDEADALFGKRSEVRDSHDRYANLEISYLLQKMEEYDGVAILATNMRAHLDEAFLRRLAFIVHFPFPDEQSRRRIWNGVWPREIPFGDDLNFDFLARQFKTSGGVIKNIALAAVFFAAEQDSAVSMRHLVQATQREFLKLGKNLGEIKPGNVSESTRVTVGQME